MDSGETKDKQANFCPAIGLSSSNKSIYLGLESPDEVFLSSTPEGGGNDIAKEAKRIEL